MAIPQGPPNRPGPVLRLIALFKVCKAALLILVGLGAVRLVHADLSALTRRWLDPIAMNSTSHVVRQLVALASGVSPRELEVIAVGSFLYAALYTVEGLGLWYAKRWAEYLILALTFLFVPFEIYAVTRRVTLPKVAGLSLNLAVAAYMVYALRRPRGDTRGSVQES